MKEEDMPQEKPTRYNIVVKNRPGELAKLTKLLTEEGVNLSSLTVANLGDKASIQFSTPQEKDLPERLLKNAAWVRK
jgi:acetolactate synthase small subunit